MSFKNFLEEREADLIKAIGKDNWEENKLYFVDEIIKFYEEYQREITPKIEAGRIFEVDEKLYCIARPQKPTDEVNGHGHVVIQLDVLPQEK